MTLQEEFEQQYEALNAYPAGFMLTRRLADAYSEPRETRAYRWFVRGRSFGVSEDVARKELIDDGFEPPEEGTIAYQTDVCMGRDNWIAIGSLMGWIPEKEK